MSARDDLFSLACQDMPVTPDEVNAAIDAYAHELAEKIRFEILDHSCHDDAYANGAEDAASLIDPEVTE